MGLIGFNTPSTVGRELEYVQKAIANQHIAADGYFTNECNEYFKNKIGIKKSLLTTSCTHALEAISCLIDIKPGDEIIIPSYTFVSTANAFISRGGKPIFIDIRKDTLNMDENILESLITKNTKAIVPVHYAGIGCEMDTIIEIAKFNDIFVIEDNAHGLFGKYKEKYLGTFGTFSAQSFHETKNVTCGEGGALFINDSEYFERADIIFDKGTDRKKFTKGEIDKYSWVDFGSSYRLAELLASFLYGQLESVQKIQSKRKKTWLKYHNILEDWAIKNEVKLPYIPSNCESSYHMFYLIMPNKILRDELIVWLRKNRINSVFHYTPLHNSKMSEKFEWDKLHCPVTIDVSERIIRLPMFYSLETKDLDYILDKILDFNHSQTS